MPSPIDTELRVHASPVPTHTVSGLLGSSVIAPIDCTGCLSNTGLNGAPPPCDFHTPPEGAPPPWFSRAPPEGAPMYGSFLLPPPRAAPAAIRPLIVAEPMLRAPSPEM